MRKGMLLLILLTVGLISVGCGNAANNKTTQHNYANDGYMGMSTANSGILTSPNSRTYGNDVSVVELALQDMAVIRKTTVFYNGANLTVRIKLDKALTKSEVNTVREEAESRLAAMMPRYTIRVRAYQ